MRSAFSLQPLVLSLSVPQAMRSINDGLAKLCFDKLSTNGVCL
jgi:hypothetical protein